VNGRSQCVLVEKAMDRNVQAVRRNRRDQAIGTVKFRHLSSISKSG
jgi:hypothetical protein